MGGGVEGGLYAGTIGTKSMGSALVQSGPNLFPIAPPVRAFVRLVSDWCLALPGGFLSMFWLTMVQYHGTD